MTRWWPALALVLILGLGYCYGQERAARATADARIPVLQHRADSLLVTIRSLRAAYAQSRRTADSVAAIARTALARRGRVVASTDSMLHRVDTLLARDPTSLAPIVLSLRASLLSERAAADSAIASLSATVALKDLALSAADSVIAVQQSQLSASSALVSVLRREARPSFATRAGDFLRHAAIGAAVMAVFVVARR